MKIAVCQPAYPKNHKETLSIMNRMVEYISGCDEDIDLIVLPEYANCPGMSSIEEMKSHYSEHNENFIKSLKAAVSGKQTALSFTILNESDGIWTNRSLFIDKDGSVLFSYDKTHLSHTEIFEMGLTPGNEIKTFEFMGFKIGYAVCFEMYFPSLFERLSSAYPDIILSPSYQRSEESAVLIKQAAGRALDTNAYIIRSSYSMGSESLKGGTSFIMNPSGDVELNIHQKTGCYTADIDIGEKRIRPVAHGFDEMDSREIIERFRKPEIYRSSGAHMISASIGYPRVCAHRGASALVPENTLPAFAVAKALGADEIEFDIRLTSDNKMIVCHDNTVDRVSDGSGDVSSFTFDEIRKLNAGAYMGWRNIYFPTPDEVFALFSGQMIFNIHLYDVGEDGFAIDKILDLIKQYGIENHVYFAAQEKVMQMCLEKAPRIRRCMLECFDEERDIVDIAKLYDCHTVQHFYSVYSPEIVKKATECGLKNNLFFEDDPSMVPKRFEEGIDTILTNQPDQIIPAIRRYLP